MKFQTVHRDQNHLQIVKDVKKRMPHYTVIDLAAVGRGVSDIICTNGLTTVLAEIKMPGSQVYVTQLEFLANWPGIAGLVETTQDLINLVEAPEKFGLNTDDRLAIRDICAETRAKSKDVPQRVRLTVKKFDEVFAKRRQELAVVPF